MFTGYLRVLQFHKYVAITGHTWQVSQVLPVLYDRSSFKKLPRCGATDDIVSFDKSLQRKCLFVTWVNGWVERFLTSYKHNIMYAKQRSVIGYNQLQRYIDYCKRYLKHESIYWSYNVFNCNTVSLPRPFARLRYIFVLFELWCQPVSHIRGILFSAGQRCK